MTMRDGDGKFIKKPFTKFNHPFLMARRAEMTPLTGEGDQIFVTAIVALHTGKAVLQTTAIKVAKDGQPDLGSQIPETRLILIFVHPLQFLEIILDTTVIVGYSGIARGVWRT